MKRTLKMAGLAGLILVMGCFGAAPGYKKSPPLAPYAGKLRVAGLHGEVNVYRDEYAVPHLMTEDEHDLFFAAGFVQAQDRMWQMVLFRAIAEGRTAELLGRINVPGVTFKGLPLNTIQLDSMQRTMGMKFLGEVGAELLRENRPEVYRQIAAYSEGVNAYIASHQKWEELPIEFQVLRVRPEPWRPADVVTFGRFMGFYLGYNMMVELLRYSLIASYGETAGWEITPTHLAFGPTIVPPELLINKLPAPRNLPPGERPPLEEMGSSLNLSAAAARDLLRTQLAMRQAIHFDTPFASNNWIVSGQHTASGKPMLANDPHMLHMEPSMWYMMHLQGAGIDCFGAAFPGTPYTALGHTPQLAWAATTSIADVQDLFLETVDDQHPGQYFYQGQWRPFTVRKEILRVRVGSRFVNQEIEIPQTVHGPIMSSFLPFPKGTPPVALRWVAWDFSRDPQLFELLISSRTVEEFMAKVHALPAGQLQTVNQAAAISQLMRGKSVDDFVAAMDLLDLPSQNWMAVDGAGRIAYLPGGLVPIRKKGLGALPAPGKTDEFEWVGFIPTRELPQAIDPARGWMVSANNEVVDAEWYPYLFDLNYDSGWRAWRIEELLQEQIAQHKPFTLEDFKRIQNDIKVKRAEVEVPLVLTAVETKKVTDSQTLWAAEQLRKWDFMSDLGSVPMTIFYEYTRQLRRNVLADEVSKEDYETFLSENMLDGTVELIIYKGKSPLFDDKATPGVVEDMNDMMVKSLKDAMVWLTKKWGDDPAKWAWGEVHYIKFYHPLGIGPLADLSVGPWPQVGSRHVVRCASPADSGRDPYKDLNGSSWRHLVDMADPAHAWVVIDGSESGQWLSPHYRDLHEVWRRGDYIIGLMLRDEIITRAKYHLVLSP